MAIRLPWANVPVPEPALELQKFDAGFRGDWSWEQPARFRARWHLTCDGAPVATLARHPMLVAPTVARYAQETWEIRHKFPAGTLVTRAGDAEAWGSFRLGWFNGGRLERAQGSPLLWRPLDFWGRLWAFTTLDHMPLVRLRSRYGFLLHGASIELEDAARRMPDLPALLALGWTLVLSRHRGRAVHY